MKKDFFFLLSGEYKTLPAAELRSVLKILDPKSIIKEVISGRIAIAETTLEAAREAVKRAAYTKLCGIFFGRAENDPEEILRIIDSTNPDELIPASSLTFAVRGRRILGSRIDKLGLEKRIGERILRLRPELKVNLEDPDAIIYFISTKDETVVGRLIDMKPRHFFSGRLAGRRPFSLPSAMQPDFSRAMINLAEVKPGGRILDPFAGTGGILVEAILLGYAAYGIELKDWIARGALKNLSHYCGGYELLIVGDARSPMFRKNSFDAIVTDPPYGRSTTIPDKSIYSLLDDFLSKCIENLKDGGRIVISIPAETDIDELILKHGLRIIESHLARVHGSLIRRVVVAE